MCNGVDWTKRALIDRKEPETRKHQNPRPPGVIRPGSGTDVLLRFLARQPERWFFHPELVLALGRSKGEVDWALQYLAGQGLITSESAEFPGRKAVLRYQLRACAALAAGLTSWHAP